MQPAESTVSNSSPGGFCLILTQELNRRTLCKGSDLIFLSLEFIFVSISTRAASFTADKSIIEFNWTQLGFFHFLKRLHFIKQEDKENVNKPDAELPSSLLRSAPRMPCQRWHNWKSAVHISSTFCMPSHDVTTPCWEHEADHNGALIPCSRYYKIGLFPPS